MAQDPQGRRPGPDRQHGIDPQPAWPAEERTVPGYCQGNLLFGSNISRVMIRPKRQTRLLMLVRVPGEDTETVIEALIRRARKLRLER